MTFTTEASRGPSWLHYALWLAVGCLVGEILLVTGLVRPDGLEPLAEWYASNIRLVQRVLPLGILAPALALGQCVLTDPDRARGLGPPLVSVAVLCAVNLVITFVAFP